ncbi:hypothetical protein JQC91_15245 [Jannaschia sp. Os4]|uniref:CAP domain-containing protein n=1 Tax=Jannaschia sp. Os4 TaxID=2807617 RepID=UPI00193ABC3B|nr:CAP domain-containing protein [Jannaschia sp. Os4]MBM2577661.1 hypothetical protein [Jannaschia sp. Os4]
MSTADQFEREMLDLINADRARFGLDPLQLEQNLNASAEAHSEWMLRTDTFSHTGVGGSSATERMADAGFDFSNGWRSAENIAVQSERGPGGISDDVADLHRSLMDSPGHRANLLNPDLDYIGIGIERGDFDFSSGTYDSVIVTQNFASTGGGVDLDTGAPAAAVPDPAPEPITGGRGEDVLRGSSDADTIAGRGGADRLYGGGGRDALSGNGGADRLYGGNGNDRLTGGKGDDLFVGGRGADRFVFTQKDDRDVIRDFEDDVDTIVLRDFGLADIDALEARATQAGDHLELDFGGGDVLRIRDVTFDQIVDDVIL